MRQIRRWKNDSSVCWDDKGGRMKQIRTERTGMERIRMDRVNAILKHKTYRKYYDQIEKIEKDRIFCRHQMPHLLDVARIAYITNLERNLGYDREVIYAAAILHDIGKSFQYEERIPHEIAGEKVASEILDTLPELSLIHISEPTRRS